MDKVLETIKEWACNLIIIQYRGSEQNKSTIRMLVDLIFANMLGLQMQEDCLNVDKSKGVLLDVVGLWVGIGRFTTFYEGIVNKHYAYPTYKQIQDQSYTPIQVGFSNYLNFITLKGIFIRYRELIYYATGTWILSDDRYRKLIKLKIIKNSIRHTRKNIDDSIYLWSEGHVVTTWNDMEITYTSDDKEYDYLLKVANEKNILLTPSACTINLVYSE